MKIRIALTVAALALVGVACSTEPDTLGVKSFDGATTDETTPATSTPVTEAPKAISTCDVAREALLTGTQSDKDAAMAALVADTAADAKAREAAQGYLNDDNQYGLKDMYASSVQMFCSF